MSIKVTAPLNGNDEITMSRKVQSGTLRGGSGRSVDMSLSFKVHDLILDISSDGTFSEGNCLGGIGVSSLSAYAVMTMGFNGKVSKLRPFNPVIEYNEDTLYDELDKALRACFFELGLISNDIETTIDTNIQWASNHIYDYLESLFD